ncbi:MAG: Arc/MetJ-type ribon-helix-helix transcriptional regulator [Lentimonas sp.]|jgi:Arc/MetJ-type ribon-helix-helix transcriptional regulator
MQENNISGQSIPFSVRLPQEYAEFIANLEIKGAKTPSDKIRAIIKKAHEEEKENRDYKNVLRKIQKTFIPALDHLHKEELKKGERSELVRIISQWLSETYAFFISTLLENKESVNLNNLEKGMADRIFILFEQIMRMGVTTQSPCYNKAIIKEHLAPVLELAGIIVNQKKL